MANAVKCLIAWGAAIVVACAAMSLAAATKCKCEHHNAEAEASGTCSRTEDSNYCTLTFSATTPEQYQEFVQRLQLIESEIGVPLAEPRDALGFAFNVPPQQWGDDELRVYLPTLFAISQREIFSPQEFPVAEEYYFGDLTPILAQLIQEHAEDILPHWQNDNIEDDRYVVADELAFGGFDVTVSYGCITFREREQDPIPEKDSVVSMVKTRFSLGGYFCNDTAPTRFGQ